MDQRLATLFVSQRDVLMVFAECDDLMMSDGLRMHGDPFSAVPDLDIAAVIANPDLLARI